MRNFIGNLLRLSTVCIAIVGFFAPMDVRATSENILINGNFSANGGGWTGANGGAECSSGSPSLGLWGGPQLTFSYVQHSVSQQVTIPTSSTVELSFSASGPWGGTYSATLSDSNETVTTGVLTAGQSQTSTLSVATTSNDEIVTVTFSGVDSLFWAGCYGPIIQNASLTATAPPTSLVVTSLLDDGSIGTLRWAINQANATSGGIYDSIQIPAGTITLTSALPNITQNVTIIGSGKTSTIIDGDSQFRIFNVNNNISLTISDLTLKRGQNTNGGLIYNNRGTVTADRVRFTSMTGGSAVFNNNGGAVAYYTDSTWDYLSIGVAGDYGSTPNLAAGVTSWSGTNDTVFQNRTYVTRGTFENNTHGIYNYRFTKVIDSTFNNNSGTGANVTGLNRTQIINSSFTNNGTAIYHSSWIPVGWNMGTDNRLITGNTFTNNTIAINLNDSWNNNQKNQSWSIVQNNIWDGNGTWIAYQQWDGSSNVSYTATPSTEGTIFIQSENSIPPPPTTTTTTTTTTTPPTTTTTTPPTCGPYQSVSVTGKTNGAVWGSGPYTDDSDLGVAAVHAGLIEVGQTATIEFYDIAYYQSFPGSSANGITTANWNSGWCGFNIRLITPTNTTTTEPEPTTTTEPVTTTTEPQPIITDPPTTTTEPEIIPPVVIPPDTQPPATTEPEVVQPEPTDPPTTEPEIVEPESTIPEDIQPEETVPEDIQNQVDEILSGDLTQEEFSNAVDEILTSADNEEELVAAATELLSGDLSEEQFTEVINQVFTQELSDEAFAEVLDTVFEEPLSDEEFTAVIDAVLDQPLSDEQFAELVDVLSSDTVTDDQVKKAVDAIIENGITEDQATEIATSAEVLSSIDGDQAAAIFAEIPIDSITEEQALEIIAAVQDAPTEVRSSFEEEINIFGSGSLNTYVPLGSTINVGQRRAVIAAGAVIAAAPAAGAASGSRRRK